MTLAVWIAVLSAASAEIPDGLRPVAADGGTPGRFAAWRVSSGLPAEQLACEAPVPTAVLLCFRVWEGSSRRWVTVEDLQRWGTDLDHVRTSLQARAKAKVAAAPLVAVEGMPEHYLKLLDGDGWAAAGLLVPDALAARLGSGPIRVAWPAESLLLAWSPAGEELDRVMAVGVKELYDTQKGSVSPTIFTWDGTAWAAFGEAVPTRAPSAKAR